LTAKVGSCWKGGCELGFSFSHDMVVPGEEPEQAPVRITFDPPQAGRFEWRSARQLAFVPEADGMPWGQRMRVIMHHATPLDQAAAPLAQPWERLVQVPFFHAANKVAGWPVQAGCPRLVGLLGPKTVERIGRGPLYLLYDQPVQPATLRRRLMAVLPSGRQLPARVFRPLDVKRVYGGTLDLGHVIAVQLKRPPLDGKAVLLQVPSCSSEGTVLTEERELEARSTFVLANHQRAEGRVPLSHSVELRFNNPVSVRALREHLQVKPEPRSSWIDGRQETHRVHLRLQAGQRYRLSFRPGLQDLYGNQLKDRLALDLHAQDLPPSLQAPAQTVILERGGPGLPMRGTNVGRLRLVGRRFESPKEYIVALAAAGGGCEDLATGEPLPEIGSRPRRAALNQPHQLELPMPRSLGAVLACVQVSAAARGRAEVPGASAGPLPVQVTGLGVTTKVSAGKVLVWVTRLADADPVQGAALTLLDAQGRTLAEERTDESGVGLLHAPGLAQAGELTRPVFVVASDTDDLAVAPVRPGQLAQPWQLGLQTLRPGGEALPASLVTERGVYRPGEDVHLLGFVRPDGAAAGNLPPLELGVHDARGRAVQQATLQPDRFGVVHHEFRLSSEAAVGEYTAEVAHGGHVRRHRFRVEEYRAPSFRVELRSPQGSWRYRQRTTVQVQANYLRGGELAGRDLDYRITRQRAPFRPKGYDGFLFVGDAGAELEAGLGQGQERLDGQGRFAVQLIPDHPSELGPVRYVLETTVQDVDRQAVTAYSRQTVHPSAFYLGLRPPPRGVLAAGQRLELPVVALRPDGRPVAGVRVTATLERVEHHTARRLVRPGQVQHVDHVVHRRVRRLRLKTGRGARVKLRIPRAGEYRLVLRAKDRQGRKVATVLPLVASGGQPSPWPRYDHERIEVIADRPSYAPGDVARLVVASPFRDATGLVSFERGGVLEFRLVRWRGDTPAIEVPITADMVPNLFVSVAVVRGRTGRKRDAAGLDTGGPAFRLGYAELEVEPVERRLQVEVVPEHEQVAPGSELAVRLKVRSHDGAASPGQVAVMVVDEAVLALTGYRTPGVLQGLYPRHGLGVRTAASLLELPGSRQARHEQVFPGGDGHAGGGAGPAAAPLGDAALRSVFRSTAWLDPAVTLDADGEASVRFRLPDNLTRYRIMALAVDGKGGAGSGEAGVVLRRPLMVQPVVPRFVYPGDRLVVGGIVQNGTRAAGRVKLSAALEGLSSDDPLSTTLGPLAAGATARSDLSVRVTGHEQATLRLTARMGEHEDSVRVVVPVRNPGVRRKAVVSQAVTGQGELAVTLPAERRPGSGKLEVVVSTTRLDELADAVGYLMGYPNGCIEQTTSRAYPLVALHDLLPELGVQVDEAKLKEYTEAGVKRLLGFQTEAGGLSYWPGGKEPHAFGTAFGLTALIAARHQGYEVPAEALGRMADYLLERLRSGRIEEQTAHGNVADADTRAFIAMTLNRLQRPQPAYVDALWRQRERLSPFGLAFLAVAVQEGGGPEGLREPLLNALAEASEQDAESAWYDGARAKGASMGSPLRSHAGALLAYAAGGSASELTPKLLRGLLQRRVGGLWGNTQENVFGVMAVARLVAGGPGEEQGPSFELSVGERRLGSDTMEEVSGRMRRVVLAEDELKLAGAGPAEARVRVAGATSRPLHVTLRAEYDLRLSDELRKPRAQGVTVERRYETLSGRSLEGRPIPLGSLVRVRLALSSKEARSYVALADHLPAGLEPLNTHLHTAGSTGGKGGLGPLATRSLKLLSYDELRDHRVAFYVDALPAGAVEYVYLARATTPGTFLRPAAEAEAMYDPEVAAATAVDEVVIR